MGFFKRIPSFVMLKNVYLVTKGCTLVCQINVDSRKNKVMNFFLNKNTFCAYFFV